MIETQAIRRVKKAFAPLGGLLVASLLLAPAAPLRAQDAATASLSGIWAVSIESEMGMFEMTWDVTQHEDGSLTGSMDVPQMGPSEIAEGWVDGDTFEFMLIVDAQGQTMDIVFSGTFTDDEVVGMLDAAGGEFSADFTGERTEGGAR